VSRTGDIVLGDRSKTIAPIVVLDADTGKEKRSFGLGDIKNMHGMKMQEINGSEFLWVTDSAGSVVIKYDYSTGRRLATLGSHGTGTHPYQFGSVADIAHGPDGAYYISDGDGGINSRVAKFTAAGVLVWVAGNNGTMPAGGLFDSPHSIAFDDSPAAGARILVADRGNHTVRVFDAATGKEDPAAAWKDILAYPDCASPAVWTVRVDGATKQAFVGTSSFGSGAKCPTTAAQASQIVVVDLASGKAVDSMPVQSSAGNPVGFPHEICLDTKRPAAYAAAVDAPKTAGIGALSRYTPGTHSYTPGTARL
jgi:hypothetical protein